MFKSVLNKIANNIWLFLCLTAGSLLIAAILSSIPIYTNGALKKMLNNDLDRFVTSDNGYDTPGQMYTAVWFNSEYSGEGIISTIEETDAFMKKTYDESDILVSDQYTSFSVEYLRTNPDDLLANNTYYSLETFSGIEDHIDIVAGRMYSDELMNGCMEVIVSSEEYNNNTMMLGKEYSFTIGWLPEEWSPTFRVVVVGVYEPKYEDTEYWYQIENHLYRTFIVDRSGFEQVMFNPDNAGFISDASWYYHIDLYNTPLYDVQNFVDLYENLNSYFQENFREGTFSVSIPVKKTLIEYVDNGYYHVFDAMGNVYRMYSDYAISLTKLDNPVLNTDGTLNCPQFPEAEEWTDIVDFCMAQNFILALTSDGKLLSSGIEFEHENIVKFDILDVFSPYGDLPVALTADGKLIFGELTSRDQISQQSLEKFDRNIEVAKTFTDVKDFTSYGYTVIVQKTDGSVWATQNDISFTENVNSPDGGNISHDDEEIAAELYCGNCEALIPQGMIECPECSEP